MKLQQNAIIYCHSGHPILILLFANPFWLQLNHVSLSPTTTNLQSKFYHASVRNGRWHVPSMAIKAQAAVEGDVLDKESVSINEESGI